MSEVCTAIHHALPSFVIHKSLTAKERDRMVSRRLISQQFAWTLPGRAVITSPDERVSIMVNEEDHLRIQILQAGYAVHELSQEAGDLLAKIGAGLHFASSQRHGFLAASAFNAGSGTRHSVLMHLVGTAFHERKIELLGALKNGNVTLRGPFGEGSRPVGAFAQVSSTDASPDALEGAFNYLREIEQKSRETLNGTKVEEKVDQAIHYLTASPKIDLPNALRILGWLRWASSEGLEKTQLSVAQIDEAFFMLEGQSNSASGGDAARADWLRHVLL
jgi:protein arginine kinase